MQRESHIADFQLGAIWPTNIQPLLLHAEALPPRLATVRARGTVLRARERKQ